MTADEETDIEMAVESANGSFYQHYKSGLTDFLNFARDVGNDALKSGRLKPHDLQLVERGVADLEKPIADLLPLLEKRIDERNPTFFDECTIETVWNALGAVFRIAQHSGFTDSAKAHAQTVQGKVAGQNSGAARRAIADKAWRFSCLEDAVSARKRRPHLSTSALGNELWAAMPQKPGKPSDPRTVAAFLTEMEAAGKLTRKIGRTGSA